MFKAVNGLFDVENAAFLRLKFDIWDSKIYTSVLHFKSKVIKLLITLLVILFAVLCSTPFPVLFDM